jgi:hypothetical protein
MHKEDIRWAKGPDGHIYIKASRPNLGGLFGRHRDYFGPFDVVPPLTHEQGYPGGPNGYVWDIAQAAALSHNRPGRPWPTALAPLQPAPSSQGPFTAQSVPPSIQRAVQNGGAGRVAFSDNEPQTRKMAFPDPNDSSKTVMHDVELFQYLSIAPMPPENAAESNYDRFMTMGRERAVIVYDKTDDKYYLAGDSVTFPGPGDGPPATTTAAQAIKAQLSRDTFTS